MSTSMTREADAIVQPRNETFQSERDALVPRPGYVIISGDEDTTDADMYLKIPRLNMRRTLRLSQWLDVVGHRDEVQSTLNDLMRVMETGADGPGFATILSINKFISSLELTEALELFSIITGQTHEWLDEHWEIGWGIEALRVAFRQQGFSNLFQNAAAETDATGGETAMGKEEVSAPQSISSSPHMGGQTMTYSNSHQNE